MLSSQYIAAMLLNQVWFGICMYVHAFMCNNAKKLCASRRFSLPFPCLSVSCPRKTDRQTGESQGENGIISNKQMPHSPSAAAWDRRAQTENIKIVVIGGGRVFIGRFIVRLGLVVDTTNWGNGNIYVSGSWKRQSQSLTHSSTSSSPFPRYRRRLLSKSP